VTFVTTALWRLTEIFNVKQLKLIFMFCDIQLSHTSTSFGIKQCFAI